jgi:hypothetical protein
MEKVIVVEFNEEVGGEEGKKKRNVFSRFWRCVKRRGRKRGVDGYE